MKLRSLPLAVTVLCLGLHGAFGQQPNETAGQEVVDQLRGQVESFLHSLLDRERYHEAISFFSESAFYNPGLITAPCVGILTPHRDVTPKARAEGIKQFLDAFHKELALGTQGEAAPALSTDALKGEEVDFEGITVANDWKKDKYILGLLSRDSIKSAIYPDDREDRERNFLFDALESSPPLYFNLVVVKSGDSEIPVLIVWKREAGTWKIIHIDLICG